MVVIFLTAMFITLFYLILKNLNKTLFLYNNYGNTKEIRQSQVVLWTWLVLAIKQNFQIL